MKHPSRTTTGRWRGPMVCKLLAAVLIGLSLDSMISRADDALSIAKQGNFYVGGKYVESNGDMPMVGQAFVEYQIPQRQTHPYPIVLIHGGSQTGTGWISTPDGREGWAIYFLRHGYAVYIVDQVARGRSAYIGDVYGPSRTQTREYVMQRFSTSEKYGLWPQAKFHTQWPRKGEPGDPVFDNYFASNVPSMENREMQSSMNVDALAALLDRVGPSIVLVHSQSGQYGWPLAQARPALVKAIVAAEPSGPPVHDVVVPGEPRFGVDFASATAVAGTEIFRDDPRLKRYGLSDIPMVYAPAVTSESPLSFVRQDKAEAPDLVKCWRQKEPARRLVAVGDRPILYLATEASFYAPYNHCTVEYLKQAGVDVSFVKLADIGLHGNGHMMMMEKNSDAIAQVIVEWLEKQIPAAAAMCGRFTYRYTWSEIHALYRLTTPPANLQSRYNICPTTTINAVVTQEGNNGLVPMRWGLIPSWWKKRAKDTPATFNARAETVAEKPMFRSAFEHRRCLIPASGYYEWQDTSGGKQPYYFTRRDNQPITIAGLWDVWKDIETGESVKSCTMIITEANEFVSAIHDRMPVRHRELAVDWEA